MDVYTCTMLPVEGEERRLERERENRSGCLHLYPALRDVCVCVCVFYLELIGEVGREAGAGVSVSSSSSSPHSSSLRGVMLFPSHTEWMDT